MRLESEYYISKSIEYPNVKRGGEIIDFSQYGTSKELNDINDGYPVLRLNEFCFSFIGKPAKCCNLLDSDTYNSLRLKKNDVLVCRTNGNPKFVGKSALVPKDYDYAFASYLFRVRPKLNYINSATLVAYLNSKYGRQEIEKFSMVGNQANFSPAKFREISIPIFTEFLNLAIEEITYKSYHKLEQAQRLYRQSEICLKNNFKDYSPKFGVSNFYNVKSFKESYGTFGRLDAEYYQAMYDKLFERLHSMNTANLKDIVTIQKSVEPGSEAYQSKGIPFIRVSNLSKFGLSDSEIMLDEKDFSNVIRPQKDTILLSKDGSVCIAYKVEEPLDVITSSAILHLSLKDEMVLPDYLTLVLNSEIVRLQAERDAGGSIIQHWKPSEIENVIIPILPMDKQREIVGMVKQSFIFRKESKLLLDEAQKMVEKEIENN